MLITFPKTPQENPLELSLILPLPFLLLISRPKAVSGSLPDI
jgi:hypothetical protein